MRSTRNKIVLALLCACGFTAPAMGAHAAAAKKKAAAAADKADKSDDDADGNAEP